MELNFADVNCESPKGGVLPMPLNTITSASLVTPLSFWAGSQRTCIFSEQLGITLNYTVEIYAKWDINTKAVLIHSHLDCVCAFVEALCSLSVGIRSWIKAIFFSLSGGTSCFLKTAEFVSPWEVRMKWERGMGSSETCRRRHWDGFAHHFWVRAASMSQIKSSLP